MSRTKDTPTPWKVLDPFRGTDFNDEWPTLPEQFHITVKRFASRPCWEVFQPKHYVLTFKEAEEKINNIKNWLLDRGLKKGDKVIVSGSNSPEWAATYLAVLYAGGIIVPLDHALAEKDFVTLAAFSDAIMIFADESRLKEKGMQELNLKEYVCLEEGTEWPYVLDLNAEEHQAEKVTSKEIAAILFTSGTTGVPKGVMLSHENITADAWLAQANMNISENDVFYAILPIHHAYTMLAVFIEALASGAKVVFGKKLIVSQMMKELKEGDVTMFLAVPMLFNKLYAGILAGVKKKGPFVSACVKMLMGFSGFLKKSFGINIGKKMFGSLILDKVSLRHNRICICGGGALASSTFKGFNQLGIDFVVGYGLTETSPITHLNPIYAYKEDSVGKAVARVECKIEDPDENGNGVIYIKGPMVMQGYYKNEEATKEVLSEDGWLNTGDVGHIDKENYLYLTGRAKSVIVSEGGKNVFPEEIEDKFQLYTDIEQICIIGYMIDEKMKVEGIRAIIYPSEEYRKRESDAEKQQKHFEDIIEEVNHDLHPYQKISRVTIATEPLEMTSTKKIKRFEVQRKYADK